MEEQFLPISGYSMHRETFLNDDDIVQTSYMPLCTSMHTVYRHPVLYVCVE